MIPISHGPQKTAVAIITMAAAAIIPVAPASQNALNEEPSHNFFV